MPLLLILLLSPNSLLVRMMPLVLFLLLSRHSFVVRMMPLSLYTVVCVEAWRSTRKLSGGVASSTFISGETDNRKAGGCWPLAVHKEEAFWRTSQRGSTRPVLAEKRLGGGWPKGTVEYRGRKERRQHPGVDTSSPAPLEALGGVGGPAVVAGTGEVWKLVKAGS